ncbi:MAG: HAD-IA family hydrolase [Pseudomonadota bacterium]
MFKGATIVFDLDGTLVDTAPDLTNALNYALEKHGHRTVEADLVRQAAGRGAPAMIYEALGLEIGFEHLLGDFLIHYEANISVESRPFPGAVPVLERLKGAGARLAICTNKREQLAKRLLDDLEISHHFAAVAGRDTFKVSKPDPGHLIGAVQASGGDPARSVMVGDSVVDIEAAASANIPSIMVSFGYAPPEADGVRANATIDHFDDLEREAEMLLKRLTDPGPTRS